MPLVESIGKGVFGYRPRNSLFFAHLNLRLMLTLNCLANCTTSYVLFFGYTARFAAV